MSDSITSAERMADPRRQEDRRQQRTTTCVFIVREFLERKISRVETPEPMENIESPKSNTERRNERGFALPFDVRCWMFDVGCSSGFMGWAAEDGREVVHGGNQ